jgi:hypothetical protein
VGESSVGGLPAVIPPRGGVVAFFASVARGADWVLPSRLRIAAAPVDAPVVRITGSSILGCVEVRVAAG